MVSFPDAVKMFFSRYVDFQGRSRRSEYWWVQLFIVIVVIALYIPGLALSGMLSGSGDINPVGMIFFGILGLFGLAIIIPGLALTIRRLHDFGQTGWLVLLVMLVGVIPLGSLVATLVVGCIPGTVGPNKYGPDPKNPGAGAADTFV